MGLINVIPVVETGGLGFFAQIINWLVSITSSVAVGIILFTLLLKIITFPFDFMSRASMRKNSLKMEQMRPELEKLQKQYANDKALYNQKMMALYKKNGYSMFGACLPTIITLVIFIIAINGFNSYSQFKCKEYLQDMSIAYNSVIYDGLETDDTYIIKNENGTLTIKYDQVLTKVGSSSSAVIDLDNYNHKIIVNKNAEVLSLKTTNGYMEHTVSYSIKQDGTTEFSASEYRVILEKVQNNENLKVGENKFTGTDVADAVSHIEEICKTRSAQAFRNANVNFLWVKNLWLKDSPLDHPIQSDAGSFNAAHGSNVSETDFLKLTAKLEAEKGQPNGYFILCILTAAMSFLMQFVMSKSQKAQMELQTVDGQGAKTQKMMMWLMPIMMAVFSFIYTASFSIYMVLSSAISIGTTLLINKIIDVKYKKKQVVESGKTEVIRGRVYVPKQEEVKKEKKSSKKEKVVKKENEGDFIQEKKIVKHPRGRLK